MFRALIDVKGVGPRAAQNILSGIEARELAVAVAQGDVARLTKVQGVGKKTAERLIVDLKGKVAKIGGDGSPVLAPPDDDAHAALIALGYTATEAATALRNAPSSDRASTEERVSAALRAAGRPLVAGG
jgi:Holliday junction DNA helicase RuvA